MALYHVLSTGCRLEGTVICCLQWKGALEGTLSAFAHWKGTLEGTSSCFICCRGTHRGHCCMGVPRGLISGCSVKIDLEVNWLCTQKFTTHVLLLT